MVVGHKHNMYIIINELMSNASVTDEAVACQGASKEKGKREK
jgi:hypothetical protein